MDPLRLSCERDGFFTRTMAYDAGYDDRTIAAMVRGKVWFRFRRGYYSFTDIWSSLDEVERHGVRCRAVLHSLGDAVALSHVSGALAHGLSVWGVDLSRVHVTRLDGATGRIEGDVVHHVGRCSPGEVLEVEGLPVLDPTRCALELGSTCSSESALVTFDSLLRRALADPAELFARFHAMARWPGVQHLHVPVRMADGGAESPGESRGRWLFWKLGLPAPVCQYPVHDDDGVLIAMCDWGWPDLKRLGEFDGKIKYGRLLKPGQTAGDVVFAEKRREDLLRELSGFPMIRLTWEDYDRPRVTGQRLERHLRGIG
jgi:hypothetical protein